MSPGTGLSHHRSRTVAAPPSEFPKNRMGMSTATPLHLTSQTTHPLLPLVFFPSEPIRPPQINTPISQVCFPYYLPKSGPNDRFLYLAHLPVRAKSLHSSFTVDFMGAAERRAQNCIPYLLGTDSRPVIKLNERKCKPLSFEDIRRDGFKMLGTMVRSRKGR
ncbi:hypothetical protein I314_00979 [Cryptococcus bacillisporus CA1873]|uniref:Velvet domain-containing protein n=1 Tax=Cryptococcus bacillisporus CA1873 TaxID=1296111 RepID=A0ABR5BIB3_CRYGA|nr:hypothetical protein I314_00979 [Cryptococcus bacillisporus CA1873]|eukprot:KIR68558.1 hypothetical protein I314_00979 [Cryptococcus gattii CA1873]